MIQLANRDGVVSKNYEYDAFGNERSAAPNDTNPFRYSGEYFDSSSGTYYLRARYYDPKVGRFISEDSYRGSYDDPLSLNLYTYCGNSPVRFVDPSGHNFVGPNGKLYRVGDVYWENDVELKVIYQYGSDYTVPTGRVRSTQENKPDMTGYLVPPAKYSPTGEWSTQDLLDFIAFEGGKTLQWSGCSPELMASKLKFEKMLSERGWTVTYTSAYRPLIYQAHFYDIKYGDASKTSAGQADAKKHGLAGAVAKPDPRSPHVSGVAFDAIVKNDKGVAMNGKDFVNPELVAIANRCGLNVNIPKDYVHFQLK